MNFVSKLGLIEATEMVLDFKSQYKLPFIFDTYQLADFLSVGRKKLFEVTKNSNDMYMKTRIPKRSGGTRELSVPNLSLKHIQKKINRYLLRHVPISKYATAYGIADAISRIQIAEPTAKADADVGNKFTNLKRVEQVRAISPFPNYSNQELKNSTKIEAFIVEKEE